MNSCSSKDPVMMQVMALDSQHLAVCVCVLWTCVLFSCSFQTLPSFQHAQVSDAVLEATLQGFHAVCCLRGALIE